MVGWLVGAGGGGVVSVADSTLAPGAAVPVHLTAAEAFPRGREH